jgi:signal transduction histidine kinase
MNNVNIETTLPDSETILAMLSHDLKTPIYASIMAISLLNDKRFSPLNSYQKEILDAMPALEETQYVRHVRFNHPLVIKMDGKKQQGVVMLNKD